MTMKTNHKKLLFPGLALAFSLACSMTHAAEQKTLKLFNWADYFAEDTIKNFTAETGIVVIYDVMDSSETLEAKMMTGNSGYDLIFPGDTVAERLMRAGSIQKLDKTQLTEMANIDPGLLELRQRYPKSSAATVPYTWGTIGFTYNADEISKRLPNAPVNSLDLLFKPENAGKLANCGISMIDSPDEVLAVVLNYLGHPPRSADPKHLAEAEKLLVSIKPYIKKFQSQPVTDLVNGDLCLSLGYSGDMTQANWAAEAAEAAGKPAAFQFRLPKEGTTVWMDTMAIPVDAAHPEYAYAFINFIMRPQNMADITNFTGYPTSNELAKPMVAEAMRDNPDIYPPKAVYATLITGEDIAQKAMRARMRAWTNFKTAKTE